MEKKKASAEGDMGAPAVGPSVPEASVADASAVVGAAVVVPSVEGKGKATAEEKGKAPAAEEKGKAPAAGEKRTVEVADLEEEAAGKGADAVDEPLPIHERFLGPEDEGYYSSECEYDSGDDVDETNYKSFMEKLKIKFDAGELVVTDAYGRYRCPFCPTKRFKVATKPSLDMHALSLRGDDKDIKGQAEHLALAHHLLGLNLPPYGQRSKKKMRKF